MNEFLFKQDRLRPRFFWRSGFVFRSRFVFHNGESGNAENSEIEFLEAEVISPVDKRKEMENKLSDAVARLENQINAMKNDPKYKDIVAVAQARLEAAKKGMKKLTDAQVNKILSDIRLSIITANRERMAARLVEIQAAIDRERENKLADFKKVYDELAEKYKAWPKMIKALTQSFSVRKAAVIALYLKEKLTAQTLYANAFRALGQSVEDVAITFSTLENNYEKLIKNELPKVNQQADQIIDINQYRTAANDLYETEIDKMRLVLHNDQIAVLKLAFEMVPTASSNRESQERPAVTQLQELADTIKTALDSFNNRDLSRAEIAKRVADLHESVYKALIKFKKAERQGATLAEAANEDKKSSKS
jgi:hypothetical protein